MSVELDCILAELRCILDKLESFCQLHTYNSTPILLIQPPSARPQHALGLIDRIAELDSRLAQVAQTKTRLSSIYNYVFRQQCLCALATSPISCLPTELLQKIFWFCVFENGSAAHTLSLVCHEWRLATQPVRPIWAMADIPLNALRQIVPLTLHSADLPLRLCIRDSNVTKSGRRILQERLQTLLVRSDNPGHALSTLIGDPYTPFAYDSLLYLDLYMYDPPFDGYAATDRIAFIPAGTFPNLRELRLRKCMLKLHAHPEHLTTIILAEVSVGETSFHELLEGCRQLTFIALRQVYMNVLRHGVPLVLSPLRTLELSDMDASTAHALLTHIRAPALESFMCYQVRLTQKPLDEPSISPFRPLTTEEEQFIEKLKEFVSDSIKLSSLLLTLADTTLA